MKQTEQSNEAVKEELQRAKGEVKDNKSLEEALKEKLKQTTVYKDEPKDIL